MLDKDKDFKEELELKALEDEKKEREFEELLNIIKPLTPGTPLRAAIDDIARAGMGALIVLGDSPEVLKIKNGGIKIDCKFTPQQLIELCKMDGAIVLSDDLKKIVYCNTQLVPDPSIETNETGTRHRAAERTAKQTATPVIAISERRKTITLYYKNIRYNLRSSEEILSKATETLRMLEKHKEILNELLINLNILELTNFVSLNEIVLCIQRMEIISRIARTIKKYIIELGAEGNLVKILLKEMTKGLEKEKDLLLRDYSRNWSFSKTALPSLTLDELIEPENIIRILLYSSPTDPVKPKGYRLLTRTSLSEEIIETIVNHFGDLQNLMETLSLQSNKLVEIIGEKETKKLVRDFENLKEQALVGKKI
ncbi:MAG: DNA integrity scanning diadenylate cyclase DisA [Candidatus Pacearchaeota archaeon]|nr:DNA integrity scanning diadenylate cyclase DisA [Candidatus Pacearchaeota archaeon]